MSKQLDKWLERNQKSDLPLPLTVADAFMIAVCLLVAAWTVYYLVWGRS